MRLKCFYLINALYCGVSDLVEGCHIHGLHIVLKGCDQFLQLVCSNFIILHNTGNLQLLDAIADRQQLSCTGEVRWPLVYWNTIYGQNFDLHTLYFDLHCPQTKPSNWMLRTHSSSLAMSVSSSQGLTSNRMEDLAISAGSAQTLKRQSMARQHRNSTITIKWLVNIRQNKMPTTSFSRKMITWSHL